MATNDKEEYKFPDEQDEYKGGEQASVELEEGDI